MLSGERDLRGGDRSPSSRLAVIALDAVRPRVVADFWCAVLGWQVVEEDTDGVSIAPLDRAWPTIDVLVVPEGKTVKNRLHFDPRTDGVSTSQELRRLLALGAQRTDVGQDDDVSWVVLSDPEGNEFCLLSRCVQDVHASLSESSAAPPGRPSLPGRKYTGPCPPRRGAGMRGPRLRVEVACSAGGGIRDQSGRRACGEDLGRCRALR